MTGLLTLLTLLGGVCPAEQQPAWKGADALTKRDLLRACAAERRAAGEALPETRAVNPTSRGLEVLDPKREKVPPSFVTLSTGLAAANGYPFAAETQVAAGVALFRHLWPGVVVRFSRALEGDRAYRCGTIDGCGIGGSPRSSVSLLPAAWFRFRAGPTTLALGVGAGVRVWAIPDVGRGELLASQEGTLMLSVTLGPLLLDWSETITGRPFMPPTPHPGVPAEIQGGGMLTHRISVGVSLDTLVEIARPGISVATGVLFEPERGGSWFTALDASVLLPLDHFELQLFARVGVAPVSHSRGRTELALPFAASATPDALAAAFLGMKAWTWIDGWGLGASAAAGTVFKNRAANGLTAFELGVTFASWRWADGTQDAGLEVSVLGSPQGVDWLLQPGARLFWSIRT